MNVKKMSVLDWLYMYLVPKITSIGAGIVILGALFKIMHWEGAGPMLMIGMLTEAVIFFLGGFEPVHPDAPRPDWSKVFPQLQEGSDKPPYALQPIQQQLPVKDEKTVAMLAVLEAEIAKSITPDKIRNLGSGMQNLADNVAKMTEMADAR